MNDDNEEDVVACAIPIERENSEHTKKRKTLEPTAGYLPNGSRKGYLCDTGSRTPRQEGLLYAEIAVVSSIAK